jgi:hypothetical protein
MKKTAILILLFCSGLRADYVDYSTAISLLSRATSESFPEADQVYVSNVQVRLDEKCEGTAEYEFYKKVLTEKSRKNNRVRFSYNTSYDTVHVKMIEIIKPDGKRVSFDPDKILRLMNRNTSSSNIYSKKSKVLAGELPGLSIGDIVHTVQMYEMKKAHMKGHFFDYVYVENYSPHLRQYYEISLPEEKTLNVHHINKKEGFVNLNRWQREGRLYYAFDIGVAPQIIREPRMAHRDRFCYYIALTTISDWPTISRYYYSLVAPHLDTNEEMKEKVEELIAGAKTKEEKISRIFYWTAQKIRYLGVDREHDRPGWEPHDVTFTFATRGGVCRDKGALLVAMLRLAGIPADPILIHTYRDPKAPMLWFQHAIALSYDEDGNPEYFFDPTSETTKDYLPQYEEDNSYIIASEKGDTLCTVPVSDPSRNNTQIDMRIKVNKDYRATCSITTRYSGLGDTYMRSALMRRTPEQRRELMEVIVARIHPLSELKDFKMTDPEDRDKNIEIRVEYDIPDYAVEKGDYVFLPLEATKLSLSLYFDYQMRAFQLSERKYPFELPSTFSIDVTEVLELSSAIGDISAPEVTELDYKGFKLNTSFETGKELKYTSNFSVNRVRYGQEDFKELKSRLGELEKLERSYIIWRKP